MTTRGVPPAVGLLMTSAGNDAWSGLDEDKYSTWVASALRRGCEILGPSTRSSRLVSSIACWKSFHVPLRLETKKTALLSGVQAQASFSLASRTRRRGSFHWRGPAS